MKDQSGNKSMRPSTCKEFIDVFMHSEIAEKDGG